MLELAQVGKSFGNHRVLDGLELRLEKGKIGCLLGPSGCGKTTVLRLIAGFDDVSAGEIRLGGQPVSRPGYTLPPELRQIGMVFQDYALFPHLTVAENVGFGLFRSSPAARTARVRELLHLVGLPDLGGKYPHELSGGQQQRVALARALAPRPRLLLLDEPFSNLDVELRERLSLEVRAILQREGMTAILVTHDQQEAFAMADEIGVMHEGRIQQWASAYDLYHRPANRFVADFVGQGVFLPGTVLSQRKIDIELGILTGILPEDCPKGCPVDVLLRPDDVVHDDHSPIEAEVLAKTFRGASILYTLRLQSGGRVLALVPSHHDHPLGSRIGIRLDVDHVVAFKRS